MVELAIRNGTKNLCGSWTVVINQRRGQWEGNDNDLNWQQKNQ